MSDTTFRVPALFAFASALALAACGGAPKPPTTAKAECDCPGDHAKGDAKLVTIDEAARLSAAGKVTLLDVNGAETRAKFGVVPGAKLLSSATYDVAKELPGDKAAALVFYCASQQCGASHKAAARAAANGYTDVSVMPDGIKGWVDAGKPVEHPKS